MLSNKILRVGMALAATFVLATALVGCGDDDNGVGGTGGDAAVIDTGTMDTGAGGTGGATGGTGGSDVDAS